MDDSYFSSINFYQSGSELIIHLHHIASNTPGVLGNRFGSGWQGGCVIALGEKKQALQSSERILSEYLCKYPQKAEEATAFIAQEERGVQII
jgi:galactokinase